MVGAEKGKWIKPMDSVIAATMYSKCVHQEMGFKVARPSKDDLALLAELMHQKARWRPIVEKPIS